jgi:hypothetical protein
LSEEHENHVAREGDQVGMGKIDQPHHPEDHADAQSGESVETAHADGVDEDLRGLSHQDQLAPLIATPK